MKESNMELMAPGDIAAYFGVSKVTVWRWQQTDLPKPDAVTSSGPVWKAETIRKWKEERDGEPRP